jgi:hypothetical protein
MRNFGLALLLAAAAVWQAMAQTSAGLNGVVLDSSAEARANRAIFAQRCISALLSVFPSMRNVPAFFFFAS